MNICEELTNILSKMKFWEKPKVAISLKRCVTSQERGKVSHSTWPLMDTAQISHILHGYNTDVGMFVEYIQIVSELLGSF